MAYVSGTDGGAESLKRPNWANLPSWLLGLWLLVLYCTLLTYTVFAFGAYQMHIGLASTSGALWIDDLRDGNAELQTLQNKTYELYADADAASAKKRSKIDVRHSYEAQKTWIFEVCRREIRDRKLELNNSYDAPVEFCELANSENNGDEKIETLVAKHQERTEFYDRRIVGIGGEIDQIQREIDDIEKKVAANLGEERELIKDWTPQTKAMVSKIQYFDTAGYNRFFYFLVPNFVDMSVDVLALIIVLAMGAIGGALHITRNFLAPESADNIDTYLVRYRYMLFQPFLGAFTAFAVYIFFRAGVIVMSSSSSNDTSMSPFFIAFLAITSGFLANVALDVIESTGRSLFRAQSDTARARWAFALKDALIEAAQSRTGGAEVTDADLTEEINIAAKALQLDPRKLLAWVELRETVPYSFQRYIAIYLKMHPRRIFTDVPESEEAGGV